MRAPSTALSRSGPSWLKAVPGSDGRLSLAIGVSRSLLPAAGKFRIMQPGRDAGEDRSMAREGYFILDSDLHLMEPHDLWERYLEAALKANPPHFFAAHRRPEEEIKVVGMEVQGLAIPAHGRSLGAIAMGLARWSMAPRRIASIVLALVGTALRMATGGGAAWARIRRRTSIPSSPGMRRSRSTASTRCFVSQASAAEPS